nr:tyrosine-type recombinase/integrase [Actinoallomurus iriomotensis]
MNAVRFHDTRHTCVSLLLDLGVPPHIVRDSVGHSDIEVTMAIYAHAALDEKQPAEAGECAQLKGPAGRMPRTIRLRGLPSVVCASG